jgi:hypothetical protein
MPQLVGLFEVETVGVFLFHPSDDFPFSYIYENQISGTIPTQIGVWSKMYDL